MNTQNLSTPSVPIVFPQVQMSFPSVLPKRVRQVPVRRYSKPFQKNLQSNRRHQVTKIQNEVGLVSLKRFTWKQKGDVLASEKGLQFIKVITPPVINHLC